MLIRMRSKTSIDDLPDPIIEYILCYLSPYRDLKQCMLVNKAWNRYVHDVIRKTQRDFFNALCSMSVQWCRLEAEPGPTITKRYSHSACCCDNSMYIFGGCTTANTTFNDLWRLDLGTRRWIRPLATGTYPPPKACATLVNHSDNLVLFGGWTHTAPYPLHQVWRVFNQIHVYNTTTNRWTQISSSTTCPPMAGHSATVHGDYMVVFGGIQKQIHDGPFSSCNDLWTLDLKSYKWEKQSTSNDPPPPRYGQSQILIDKDHLLIMGGCGGPNTLYTDIWLLKMTGGPGRLWEWQQMEVKGKENGAPHLAFHPACKVGNLVVVMSKTQRSRMSPASLPKLVHNPSHVRTWIPPCLESNSIRAKTAKQSAPEVEHCVNGKRGVLKRPVSRQQNNSKSSQMSSVDEEDPQDLARRVSLSSRLQNTNKKSLPSTSQNSPKEDMEESWAKRPKNGINSAMERITLGNQTESGSGVLRPVNSGLNNQAWRDEKRLEILNRASLQYKTKKMNLSLKTPLTLPKHKSYLPPKKRPMCLYVLDISSALNGFVTWRTLKNQSPSAPEEIILYSLVLGKGEIIMFGGIQKDLTKCPEDETVPEIVSNCLHFMTAEHIVI